MPNAIYMIMIALNGERSHWLLYETVTQRIPSTEWRTVKSDATSFAALDSVFKEMVN